MDDPERHSQSADLLIEWTKDLFGEKYRKSEPMQVLVGSEEARQALIEKGYPQEYIDVLDFRARCPLCGRFVKRGLRYFAEHECPRKNVIIYKRIH